LSALKYSLHASISLFASSYIAEILIVTPPIRLVVNSVNNLHAYNLQCAAIHF